MYFPTILLLCYHKNMRLHRFIGNWDLSRSEVKITNPQNIKQIKDILRLQAGEKIILSDGRGVSAEATLIEISGKEILCALQNMEHEEKSKKKVNLYLAILKKENFELAAQKATETGVFGITPVITERTVKTGLNENRLKKIILEACEQSGRGFVPVLSPTLKFENALAFGSAGEEKIIFDASGVDYLPNKDKKSASIFVGPEGGFTEREIKLAKMAGYTIASLGPLTLRAETAATIATYRTAKGI